MASVIKSIGAVPTSHFESQDDNDVTDRLNYKYTTVIIIIFAFVVTTKQFVGDPIKCWCPVHFSGNHEEYTNNYCWIRNTYYLPFEDYIPKEHEDDQRHMIPYYQWIPMILLVQALVYYLPNFLWRSLNDRSGIDLNDIIGNAQTLHYTAKMDMRNRIMAHMTLQLDRFLTMCHKEQPSCTVSLKHIISRTFCVCCGRRQGNYLVLLYSFVKLLYIASGICQMFALNLFLGQTFNFYGIEVIKAAIQGEDWTQSPRFPRVTMCDLKIRRLGNIQRYTVQCVLPINLFNEKIYLFIWFWMVFVIIVTCISFVYWSVRFASKRMRHQYIGKHLKILGKLEEDSDRRLAVRFVEQYLRQDGVFILQLISHNTNTIVLSDFIGRVWEHYKSFHAHRASNGE